MKTNFKNYTTYATGLGFVVLTSPAFADPGHIEGAANGHSHFLALGAVCVALIVGGLGLLRTIKARKLHADK